MRTDFSPEAETDLAEIALFIARDNRQAAEEWIERLIARAEAAARSPRAGRMVRPQTAQRAACDRGGLKSHEAAHGLTLHRQRVSTRRLVARARRAG
ncbi:MAG: type II toxin-antitoxin system RelE/ParE family toxin [Myxococcaceae bacterium]